MDCDRVFSTLTAAPFPTGSAADAGVHRHLVECEGCRRFAEALQPIGLDSHEALPASERRRLPQYQPVAAPAVVGSAREPARGLSTNGFYAVSLGYRLRPSRYPAYVTPHPAPAFSLIPLPRRRVWWDAITLAGLFSAVAIGSWAFGVLAM